MNKGFDFTAKPFRWDLTREEQLGGLAKTTTSTQWDAKSLEELDRCCAKVVAYAGNRRLIFVGRSPESLFDYMSGLLADTSWAVRLTLFYFSMRFLDEQQLRREHPNALSAMRAYMRQLDLHPPALANSKLPVAFVDLVASGETFHNLIQLLHTWCREDGVDWLRVARRIRLIGITIRTKTSPKTWRWQQNAPWLDMLPAKSRAVKNVSMDEELWCYFGNEQKKLAASYHPARWGDAEYAQPHHDKERLEALSQALGLYQAGKTSVCRRRYAKLLAELPTMKESWFRRLVLELKNADCLSKGETQWHGNRCFY